MTLTLSKQLIAIHKMRSHSMDCAPQIARAKVNLWLLHVIAMPQIHSCMHDANKISIDMQL